MKKLTIYTVITLLFFLTGCSEERFVSEYTEYNPGVLTDNDGALTYTDFDTYPVLGTISSEAPAFDFISSYKFIIDTVQTPAGSTYSRNNLTIDPETGVITYDNADGSLSAGPYVMTVGIQTVKGLAKYDQAVTMTVNAVPITVNIDKASVDVGALEQGVIGTVSYTDDSGAGLITAVSYELLNAPANFAIDANSGEVRKTGAVDEGAQTLSVQLITNLGSVTANDIITVNVGPPPTIAYFQQDGATPLNKVTVSPWTAYTSSSPVLNGMTAVSWALIFPDELASFSGSITIGDEGEMVISSDAQLPEGDHLIGVVATNAAGVLKDFPDVFTLTVENRWEILVDDQINTEEANVLPEAAFPGVWAGYDISGESSRGGWMKVAGVASGGFSGMRRWDPGTLDACLVRTLDITDVKMLRVSFGEVLGYGAAFTNRYNRVFYFGESVANLEAASFDDSEWNTLLAEDGPWLGPNWNMGNGPAQDYTDINIDLSLLSGNTLYLMWRLYSKDVAAGNQNGQFIIDYLTAEQASVFSAEEE